MVSKKPAAKKKPDAKDKIAALIKKAFEYGYAEGVNEGNKRLNCLRTTNHYLWKELCRLDKYEPDEGVRISVAFAEKLASILQKRHSGHARELRKQIKNSNRKLKKLLEILESCRETK